MNDFLLVNLQVALDNLIHALEHLIFCKFVFDLFVEVARAEFCYDVSVVLCRVYFVQCEHVGNRFELLENFDFRLEESAIDFVLEHFHIDDFDGDRFL